VTSQQVYKKQGPARFLVALILLALAGVVSLALAPFGQLAPPNVDPQLFRWLALIQPAILAIGAAYAGYRLAPRVGFDAPLLRAILGGEPAKQVIVVQLGPAIVGGVVSGGVLIAYSTIAVDAAFDLPIVTKLLYGGVTEEIIARWGVMSFAVWACFKLQLSGEKLEARHFWTGNILASVLFSVGHFPMLSSLSPAPSTLMLWAVFACNMAPALIFGWLFAHRGLEAAILAHACAHLFATAYGNLA
jgi:hypothetical protein